MFFHYLTVVALKFEHPFKFASVSSTHLCKTWLKIVLHPAALPHFTLSDFRYSRAYGTHSTSSAQKRWLDDFLDLKCS